MFMGFFLGKSVSRQFGFQKILYRGSFLVALLVSCFAMNRLMTAQEERPQITPGERRVPRKKEAGPRALAVLQITGNGKASLVPIAILINGKFWDATAYKANPVPMSLESGTVYEAYQAGSSKGLFTVGSALHSNAPNAQAPWLGTGKWVPAGTEVATTSHTAESVPVGLDKSDEPPRLTKNPAAQTPATGTAPSSSSSGSSSPTSRTSQSSGGSNSDEPPRLKKPATSSSDPPAESSPSTASPKTDSKAGSKTDDVKADAKEKEHANVPASDSGASRENRPTLRRGKPAESFAEEEVPGYSKPGAAPTKSDAGAAKASSATSGPIQMIPAISDASGPELHSFAYEWIKGEEGDRRQQMLTYAREQIRAYVDARAKSWTPPAAPAAKGTHKPAAKLPDPILENVQMVTYDLWTNNQPILVFAADAHMPAAQSGRPTADADVQYTIMLVARTDIYNNLHKLFLSITDKYHLDVTPRLELIDAVDADGDGRGELLFRETTDNSSGWIVYRANADKLWKLFDSLNPE